MQIFYHGSSVLVEVCSFEAGNFTSWRGPLSATTAKFRLSIFNCLRNVCQRSWHTPNSDSRTRKACFPLKEFLIHLKETVRSSSDMGSIWPEVCGRYFCLRHRAPVSWHALKADSRLVNCGRSFSFRTGTKCVKVPKCRPAFCQQQWALMVNHRTPACSWHSLQAHYAISFSSI